MATSFTSLVVPQYEDAVSRWVGPLPLAEVVFMLWLLIKGAPSAMVGASPAAAL